MKNLKKLVALGLTASMVLGSNVVAFAVEGTGAVEYDDSTAIVYDQVELPTIAAATYNMTFDATKLLHTYNPEIYTSDTATVFFNSTTTKAQLDVDETIKKVKGESEETFTLWSKSYEAVAAADVDAIKAKVTVANKAVTAVTDKYFVWVPDEEKSKPENKITSGKYGKMLELTKDNIDKYLKLTLEDASCTGVAILPQHLSGTYVSDGKVYKEKYTAITADCDADLYVTPDGEGASAVENLYSLSSAVGSVHTAVVPGNVVCIPAVTGKSDETDKIVMTNKSTKAKTITATVTLENPEGLTIAASKNDVSSAEGASVYIEATNGSKHEKLVKGDDNVVKAVYEVDLAAPTIAEVTYQTSETHALGGHKYARYEAYGTEYGTPDSFYITAASGRQPILFG